MSTSEVYFAVQPDFNQAKAKILGKQGHTKALSLSKAYGEKSEKHLSDFLRDLEGSSSWEELIDAMRGTQGPDRLPLGAVGQGIYLLRTQYNAVKADPADAPASLLVWAIPNLQFGFEVLGYDMMY